MPLLHLFCVASRWSFAGCAWHHSPSLQIQAMVRIEAVFLHRFFQNIYKILTKQLFYSEIERKHPYEGGGYSFFHFANTFIAFCITMRSISTISPLSSASGKKRPGAIKPNSGCCQRTSASTPTTWISWSSLKISSFLSAVNIFSIFSIFSYPRILLTERLRLFTLPLKSVTMTPSFML